jgi:hypothetical protein
MKAICPNGITNECVSPRGRWKAAGNLVGAGISGIVPHAVILLLSRILLQDAVIAYAPREADLVEIFQ